MLEQAAGIPANTGTAGLCHARGPRRAMHVLRAARLPERTNVGTLAAAAVAWVGGRRMRTIGRANALLAAQRVLLSALGRVIRRTTRVDADADDLDPQVEKRSDPRLAYLSRRADCGRIGGVAGSGARTVRAALASRLPAVTRIQIASWIPANIIGSRASEVRAVVRSANFTAAAIRVAIAGAAGITGGTVAAAIDVALGTIFYAVGTVRGDTAEGVGVSIAHGSAFASRADEARDAAAARRARRPFAAAGGAISTGSDLARQAAAAFERAVAGPARVARTERAAFHGVLWIAEVCRHERVVAKWGRLVEDDVIREHRALVPNPLRADQAGRAVRDQKLFPRAAQLVAQSTHAEQHVVGCRLRVGDAVPQQALAKVDEDGPGRVVDVEVRVRFDGSVLEPVVPRRSLRWAPDFTASAP
jgi:hypothetical protein